MESLTYTFNWIYENWPPIKSIDLKTTDDKNKVYLIYGKIQSGKTSTIISLCHYAQLSGFNSVIVIPNSTEGYEQINERIKEYNETYTRVCVDNQIVPLTPIVSCFIGNKAKSNLENIKKSIEGTDIPRTIISLGNYQELSRLNSYDNKRPYIVVIDEADTSYKAEATKYKEQYDLLIQNSKKVVNITGTCFKIWFCEEKLYTPNILRLPVNPKYKGISSFKYSYIPEDIVCHSPSREETPLESDQYITSFLEEKGKIKPYETKNGIHPHIVLYRSSEILNEHHTQLLDGLSQNDTISSKWTIIVFNGDGIILYTKKLSKSISVDGEKSEYKNYIHRFYKTSLRELLEWLRKNNQELKLSHILIIAGKYANRMISFVSSSYIWHLTCMYLLVQKTTCDNLLQMCRLCGIYPYDNIPLEMVSHKRVIEDIKRADNLQERVIDECPEEYIPVTTHIKQVAISKTSVPKQRLTKGVKYTLNISSVKIQKLSKTGIVMYSIEVDEMKGIVGKIANLTRDIISEHIGKNVWIERSYIAGELLKRSNSTSFIKNIYQINGNLSSMAEKSNITKSESSSGFLAKRENGRWYFRIN